MWWVVRLCSNEDVIASDPIVSMIRWVCVLKKNKLQWVVKMCGGY